MSWGRRSRLAWRSVGALALALCWSTGPSATNAGAQASGKPEVELDAGYAGQFLAGSPLVARVTVRSPRLLSGDLVVDTGRAEVTREIEVAGGSVKEFLVLLPTNQFEQSVSVNAFVRKGDDVLATANDRVASNDAEEPVGLLPGAAGSGELPAAVPLSIDIGTARFARVTPAELDLAPDSLAPLGTVAAAAGEIGALSPEQRTGLLQWVHLGGRLLVDEAPGAPTPGLDGVDTAGDGRAPLGYGEVVAANGAIAAGRWAGAIEPSERFETQDRGETSMINELVARDANIRQAGLGGLSLFLLLYVFLVGPFMFFVLRRSGQRQWAWAGIPGVALIFTVGAYTLGRDLRSNARPAHATVLVSTPSGSLAKSWVGVNSTRGGTAKIQFPRQWTAQSNFFNAGGGGRLAKVVDRSDGLEASIPLGPGEFGLVEGRGSVAHAGALELTATSISPDGKSDGTVTGTIKNSFPFMVDDAAVVVGGSVQQIGRLTPGQTAEWTAPTPTGGFGGQPLSDQIAGNSFDGRGFDRASFARRGLVSDAQDAVGTSDAAAAVSAYGWTTEYSPPVEVGGTRQIKGTTLVVGLAAVRGGFGDVGEVRILRGAIFEGAGVMGGGRRGGNDNGVVLRVDVPPAVNPASAVLDAPAGRTEIWVDGKWQHVSEAPGGSGGTEPQQEPGVVVEAVPAPIVNCPPGADCVAAGRVIVGPRRGFGSDGAPTTSTLPASAIVNGRVFIRLTGLLQPFSIGQVRIR